MGHDVRACSRVRVHVSAGLPVCEFHKHLRAFACRYFCLWMLAESHPLALCKSALMDESPVWAPLQYAAETCTENFLFKTIASYHQLWHLRASRDFLTRCANYNDKGRYVR